ncbi:non-ribosomal peptide synthetase [Streptomyces sp. 1331.2]|uniref:non-ribosomal peptide synthetase n=1 Tax=Streptomyces sp. 1331.2 TaxID=1938835 RepID=UPI000BCAE8F8|nr:non-ribosomal peptide synthetase [Streptomyces sp. 1331.2]SOB88723.1 amino acid adenylation domain-containing protein [Streptomyces sp. 1331.2]
MNSATNDSTTEGRLLARLQAARTSRTTPAGGRLRRAPLSFAQRRLWFLDQLDQEGVDYVLPVAYRLRGQLDVHALERAFCALVRRHHTLRTRFAVGADGEPVQIIEDPWPVRVEVVDLCDESGDADRQARVRALAARQAGTPFTLTSARLLRVTLVRTADDEHVLLLALHHIVCDGWSIEVLIRDLCALYAVESGAPSPPALPELPLQYADFTVDQQERLTGESLERQLRYWRENLVGLEPLELPKDRPRPAVRSGAGGEVRFAVPADVAVALRELALRHEVSLFMVGLAAFQTVLARWSGQSEVTVGSPIAGRNRAEIENLVGFFVNDLVLRTDLDGDPTLTELLERVRTTCLGAYAHQDLPFERLVEELAPDRDLSRNPLFQVVFMLQTASEQEHWSLPGLQVEPVTLEGARSKFDLSCAVAESDDGGLTGELFYSTELFEPATARRLADHLVLALRAMAQDAQQRIGTLDLLSAEDRDLILGPYNDTTRPYRDDVAVHRLVEEQAARTPDAVAVTDGTTHLTYRQLDEGATRLAALLYAHGVRLQDRVALCLDRGLDTVVAVLGVCKAGGVYVPMDPDYPDERLAFMLRDTDACLVLTQERHRARLTRLSDMPALLIDQAGAQDAGEVPVIDVGPDHLAYILYTSGSTGEPKGVMIEHRSICRLVDSASLAEVSASDVVGQTSNFCFDVYTHECWSALTRGATLAVVAKEALVDSARLADTVRSLGITTLWLTSALFNRHLTERPDMLAGLKTVLYGGEAVERSVADAVIAGPWAPGRLANCYGPTEATVCAVRHTVEATDEHRPTMPIGRPLDNTEVYVMDPTGRLSPVGVPGELWIAGPGVARGYWNRPALTEQRFVRHPFSTASGARAYRTGDLVRWLPGGRLEFLGRVDDQVKLRGQRIEPGEIESVVAADEQVVSAVVVLRAVGPEQHLIAYYVPTPESTRTGQELRERCRRSLPSYMVPTWFVALESLPLTPNGKVDRRRLPIPEATETDGYAPPRDDVEQVMADVWRHVLGVQRVGIHDNFFDLGGQSLQIVRITNRLREQGIELTIRQVMQHQTIARLSEAADRTSPE